jgi:hypothetical protein
MLAIHAVCFKAGADFQVFHQAGVRLLHREPIYRLDDDILFLYLPVVAQWMAPWSLLPERLAHALWVFGSAAALSKFFANASRAAGLEGHWRASLLALALVLPFVIQELSLGQCNAFLLLAMSQSESWRIKRTALSGFLWAIACIVKPAYLVFVLVAVTWHEWRRLWWLSFTLALVTASGAISFGASYPSQLVAWRQLMAATVPPAICAPDNQSLFAIVCTYVIRPNASFFGIAVTAFALVLFGLAALTVRRIRALDEGRARFLASGLAFYATALLSPTGWQTNLVSTAPLIFFLIAHLRVHRASATRVPAMLALALVAAADLVNYHTVGQLNFQRVLHYRHYGTAALLAVTLLCMSVWTAQLARPRRTFA